MERAETSVGDFELSASGAMDRSRTLDAVLPSLAKSFFGVLFTAVEAEHESKISRNQYAGCF